MESFGIPQALIVQYAHFWFWSETENFIASVPGNKIMQLLFHSLNSLYFFAKREIALIPDKNVV